MDVHYADNGLSTGERVLRRESFSQLLGDVKELPETQRTALLLREIDALSYEQIADAMETTVPSVKSLLVRARISLAEAAEARQLSCEEVRLQLGEVAEGLTKLDAPARRHVRGCERCRSFKKQLRENNHALAAIFPVGPLLLAKKLLLTKLGSTASAGHVGAGAGATAGATAGARRRRRSERGRRHPHRGRRRGRDQGRRRARRRRDRHGGRRRTRRASRASPSRHAHHHAYVSRHVSEPIVMHASVQPVSCDAPVRRQPPGSAMAPIGAWRPRRPQSRLRSRRCNQPAGAPAATVPPAIKPPVPPKPAPVPVTEVTTETTTLPSDATDAPSQPTVPVHTGHGPDRWDALAAADDHAARRTGAARRNTDAAAAAGRSHAHSSRSNPGDRAPPRPGGRSKPPRPPSPRRASSQRPSFTRPRCAARASVPGRADSSLPRTASRT